MARLSGSVRMVAVMLLTLLAVYSRAADRPGTEYVLGPDDVIEITVPSHSSFVNEKDLDKTLTVLPDGRINYTGVGALQASGKTPSALAAEIKQALEKTRNNVVVVVSVKEIHSRRVRILGAVKAAGSYDLKPGWRLLDVVAVAGGLNARPAYVTGHIVRGATQLVPLNIAQAFLLPEGAANAALEPDDLVLLDEQDIHNQIHVMGQVNRPGAYDLQNGMTLISLISEAGSVTDHAALSKAYVLRGTAHLPLNLVGAVAQGKTDETISTFKLEPGDVLFIPEITARYGVMGQVNHPGFYPISETEESTILKALGTAGGQLPDGDLRRAGVIRTLNGKPTLIPVNIDAMLKNGAASTNFALQSDDVLYIPSRKRATNWADILNPITVLYYLSRSL